MSRRYRKPDPAVKPCDMAMTLAEVAQVLGVTPERVRQLETRALVKAKTILERWGYTFEDLLPERDRHPEEGDL